MNSEQTSTYDPQAGNGRGAVNATSVTVEQPPMKNAPIFELTKADMEDPQRYEVAAKKLLSGAFFRTIEDARKWLLIRRDRTMSFLRMDAPYVLILTESDKTELAQAWDAINSAFDASSGVAHPAFAASLAKEKLPTNLWEEAIHRARSGKNASVEEAIEAVCVEFHTPMPRIARVFQELLTNEPELLAQESEALARLNEARNKIAIARATAVGVLNTKERLAARVAELQAEKKEMELKQQSLTVRRGRHLKDAIRSLRPGALLNAHFAIDVGAAVAGADIVLTELASMLAEKQTELLTAEAEQADFLTANATALEPVARN